MHDIFFFTDIHGQYDLYRAIMDFCNEQDPEATIIFGGDAIDRGADGYKIMKELLDNPHVIYLKGNHEDMFVDSAREIKEQFNFENPDREDVKTILNSCMLFSYNCQHIRDSLFNGGMDTLLDWIMEGKPMDLIERIDKLPYTFSYEHCDFCHAGGVYKTFNRAAECEYKGEPVDSYDREALIWNRSALEYGWTPGRICVFGHTPIPYLVQDLSLKNYFDKQIRPIKYTGDLKLNPYLTGEKIDMDTGAVFTGHAFVLNVLTMKAYGFKKIDNKIEKIEPIQL